MLAARVRHAPACRPARAQAPVPRVRPRPAAGRRGEPRARRVPAQRHRPAAPLAAAFTRAREKGIYPRGDGEASSSPRGARSSLARRRPRSLRTSTRARSTSTRRTRTASPARARPTRSPRCAQRGSDFMVSTEHSDTRAVPIVTNTKCLGPRAAELHRRRRDAPARRAAQVAGHRRADRRRDDARVRRHPRLRVDQRPPRPPQRPLLAQHDQREDRRRLRDDGLLLELVHAAGRRRAAAPTRSAPSTTRAAARSASCSPAGSRAVHCPTIAVAGRRTGTSSSTSRRPTRAWSGWSCSTAADYGDADDDPPGRLVRRGARQGLARRRDRRGGHARHDWGIPSKHKTVILARALTRAACAARSWPGASTPSTSAGVRMTFTADGAADGLAADAAPPATPIELTRRAERAGATLELVTSGGASWSRGHGRAVRHRAPAATGERWYFVRVRDAERPVDRLLEPDLGRARELVVGPRREDRVRADRRRHQAAVLVPHLAAQRGGVRLRRSSVVSQTTSPSVAVWM